MIVLDTSIISTFALIGAMDLLYALFPNDDLGVTPAVYTELVVGAREGRQFLQAAVEQVESGRLKLFVLTAEEFMQRLRLPTSLGSGEAESIGLCQSRGAAFVTNDRRARNFCRSEGIESLSAKWSAWEYWPSEDLRCGGHRMVQRSPTDRTDTAWMILAPHMPTAQLGGRPRTTDRREVVHAILYNLRSGCPWRMRPTDFPPPQTVSPYCRPWRRAGVWERRHDTLRGDLREASGRTREPRAGILDSQTVKTTEQGGSEAMTAGSADAAARATSSSMSSVCSWW